jgi:hypothetical protein
VQVITRQGTERPRRFARAVAMRGCPLLSVVIVDSGVYSLELLSYGFVLLQRGEMSPLMVLALLAHTGELVMQLEHSLLLAAHRLWGVTLCVRYSCVQVRCMVWGRARIPQAGCRTSIPYSVVLGGNCNWLHFSAKQINVPSAIMCPEQPNRTAGSPPELQWPFPFSQNLTKNSACGQGLPYV